jgi:hypothetical protein
MALSKQLQADVGKSTLTFNVRSNHLSQHQQKKPFDSKFCRRRAASPPPKCKASTWAGTTRPRRSTPP